MAKFDSPYNAEDEEALARHIASFYAKPYEFVMAVFPWGQSHLPDGTPNPLAKKTGPEPWQKRFLIDLGKHIYANQVRIELGIDTVPWRSAVGSGHGVGKSALVSWLHIFFMSTRVDTRGATTASTQFQLEDKTWPELSKWHRLAINRHWFEWSATAFTFAAYPAERRKNYRITAASVSEENTEAFAGLHNEGRTIVATFDEASGVVPKLWEVCEGLMTDGEVFFFAFGNLTKPDGEFVNCFEKYKFLYYTMNVDSREVSFTNKTALAQTIAKYGIDSDEVKVRILGMKPSQSFDGFIMPWAYDEACERELEIDLGAALLMGVDVARMGDDATVCRLRQGRDHRTFPVHELPKARTTETARRVAALADRYKPDRIIIESTGPGVTVIDSLKEWGYPVTEIAPGAPCADTRYANLRAEMWDGMRNWIYEQGCLDPKDEVLKRDCTSIKYTLDTAGEDKLRMERKRDMKARNLPSPDHGDALALTFAVKVARRDRNNQHAAARGQRATARVQDDPLAA